MGSILKLILKGIFWSNSFRYSFIVMTFFLIIFLFRRSTAFILLFWLFWKWKFMNVMDVWLLLKNTYGWGFDFYFFRREKGVRFFFLISFMVIMCFFGFWFDVWSVGVVKFFVMKIMKVIINFLKFFSVFLVIFRL